MCKSEIYCNHTSKYKYLILQFQVEDFLKLNKTLKEYYTFGDILSSCDVVRVP